MSLSELGSLGEFIGSIVVVITLIYLSIQVRQNSRVLKENAKLARAQSHQVSTQLHVGFQDLLLTNPEVRAPFLKFRDQEDLSELSQEQFGVVENAAIRELLTYADDHYRFVLGLLDEGEWDDALQMLRTTYIHSADFRQWWLTTGSNIWGNGRFGQLINTEIGKSEGANV